MESALSAIETVLEIFIPSDDVHATLASDQKSNVIANGNASDKAEDSNTGKRSAPKKEQPLLARIEIAWRGRVEAMVFPLPQKAPYLPHSWVANFMLEVDLTAAETRTGELITAVPVLIANMHHVYSCSQKSNLYTFLHHNVTSIKLVMYSFVVLLNLNVLMSPQSISHPAESVLNLLEGTSSLARHEVIGLGITLFLGCVNFLGYFVIMVCLLVHPSTHYPFFKCSHNTH